MAEIHSGTNMAEAMYFLTPTISKRLLISELALEKKKIITISKAALHIKHLMIRMRAVMNIDEAM